MSALVTAPGRAGLQRQELSEVHNLLQKCTKKANPAVEVNNEIARPAEEMHTKAQPAAEVHKKAQPAAEVHKKSTPCSRSAHKCTVCCRSAQKIQTPQKYKSAQKIDSLQKSRSAQKMHTLQKCRSTQKMHNYQKKCIKSAHPAEVHNKIGRPAEKMHKKTPLQKCTKTHPAEMHKCTKMHTL